MADGAHRRIHGAPPGITAAACADAGHRGSVSHLRGAGATVTSATPLTSRSRDNACNMPRIGLLRYGGTVSLNQMRYTIRAIPTFGSIGSEYRWRGIP
jgi:hypothetical protein